MNTTDIVRIQKKGLVTLPKKMRDAAGFEENSLARITKQGNQLILEPLQLPYPVRTYSDNEVNGFIINDKKETTRLMKKKLA